jgi:predicted AlkP superfamily pyrophosphatase or phosphodiesterase
MSNKIIFIFLDGFGLSTKTKPSPMTMASLPFLTQLIKGQLVQENTIASEQLLLKGIDTCLGVEGIPQSATGQTSLFTGINAACLINGHLPAFPNAQLRECIAKDNILKHTIHNGKNAIFANSYTPGYFEAVRKGERQHSVTTLCVLSTGLPFNGMPELAAGKAVHWDITRKLLNTRQHVPMPVISPELAGQHLAGLSETYDLVLFECFLPDMIGHKMDLFEAIKFLETVDLFLYGILSHLKENVTLILTSDHGNVEEIEVGIHTQNPVPLLAIGKAAPYFANVQSLTGVCAALYEALFSATGRAI